MAMIVGPPKLAMELVIRVERGMKDNDGRQLWNYGVLKDGATGTLGLSGSASIS